MEAASDGSLVELLTHRLAAIVFFVCQPRQLLYPTDRSARVPLPLRASCCSIPRPTHLRGHCFCMTFKISLPRIRIALGIPSLMKLSFCVGAPFRHASRLASWTGSR